MNPPMFLIADDDLDWSRPLRVALRRHGAQVLPATSARELLELVERHAPDLVVLNSKLDEVGGATLVRLVRERSPRTAIALLADPRTDPPDARQALDLLFYEPRPHESERLMNSVIASYRDRLRPRPFAARAPLIVCVDDDREFLASLTRVLTRHGYRVAAFDDPERALQAMAESDPALAIVDILMPGMNGLDLAEEIQEDFAGRVPVVLLSARASDTDIARGFKHGARYYITKPCEPRTILDVVDYFIGDLEPEERAALERRL